MKKKIFLVSALVAMTMSTMFVACSSKNEPSGCTCEIEGERFDVSPYEMQEMGMKSCSAFASALGYGARCW